MIPKQITKYLAEHAIPKEKVERYGLEVTENSISIPIFSKKNELLFKKHRHFDRVSKYTYDKGAKVSLYGVHWLKFFDKIEDKPSVVLVEGEFDAMALWNINKLALSTTGGSGSWNDEWNILIKDYPVTILYDNDEAGAKGAYRVWDSLIRSGIHAKIAVVPYGFKDISEFLAKGGVLKELIVMDLDTEVLRNSEDKAKRKSTYAQLIQEMLDIKADVARSIHLRWITQVFFENFRQERLFLSRKTPASFNGSEIENIKKVPISNFINFRNKEAKCIFHADNNPSMQYNDENHNQYPNTVKCYSCGKFASVIDVVMTKEQVDFKQAVEILRKYVNGHEI